MDDTAEPIADRIGILIDGVEGTPYVIGHLRIVPGEPITITVPYDEQDQTGQFAEVKKWGGEDEEVPPSLIFHAPQLSFTLYELSLQSQRHDYGVGSEVVLRAETAVKYASENPLPKALHTRHLASEIDRFGDWARLSGINLKPETDDNGKVVSITGTVSRTEPVEWTNGDTTYAIINNFGGSSDRGKNTITLNEQILLTTTFPTGRPITDHLREQNKVRNLVSLLTATPHSYIRHHISDQTDEHNQLVPWNTPYNTRPLWAGRYLSQRHEPPTRRNIPLANLREIGVEGLQRWVSEHDKWEQFIYPAVGTFTRNRHFVEDRVIALSMSAETAGHLIGKQPGEEATYRTGRKPTPTTATYIYRCLHRLGHQLWEPFTDSLPGLSRNIANNYNRIKHYKEGGFPNPTHSYLVSRLLTLTIRYTALTIAKPEWRPDPKHHELTNEIQAWAHHNLKADDNGELIPRDPNQETD